MKRVLLTAALGGLLIPLTCNAQCKSYAKRQCKPALEEYTSVQMTDALLEPGDLAEIMLTFYSGQTYRLLVCTQEQFGDVGFKLYDTDKVLIFEADANNESKIFDFQVASTQQLILEVEIPETAASVGGAEIEGCISVLIGAAETN